MAAYEIAQCGSCHAPIIWAVTDRDRKMPVDAAPVDDGDIHLTDRTHLGLEPLAVVLPVAKRFGKRELRMSHFATCPQARAWRRRKDRSHA